MLIRGKRLKRRRGQALMEYVILIAVVALAALFVLASFSDRLRDMISGITTTLGGEKAANAAQTSVDIIQNLSSEGLDANGN